MRLVIANRIPRDWNRELMVELIGQMERQINLLTEGNGAAYHGALSAAPTTGTWARGDWVKNSAPASAGYFGFVCTAAGTPGTWKGFGLIA